MLDRIVEWVRAKSVSNPFAFGLTTAIVLGLILVPLLLIFPWLGHFDDPRWQEFSSASLILFLVVANRKFVTRIRFWISIIVIALAHLVVLSTFTKFVPHARPLQYLLLTYIDAFVGEWILVLAMREHAST